MANTRHEQAGSNEGCGHKDAGNRLFQVHEVPPGESAGKCCSSEATRLPTFSERPGIGGSAIALCRG